MSRDRTLKVLSILVFLAAAGKPAFSQTGSASNIQLIQSVDCQQAGTSGSYSCTLTPTGAGHLLTAQEFDFAGTPGTPTVPAGWTQDCVENNGTAGQITFYSYANGPSGITSVTFTPSSGASSAVVSEWSGMATSSPFDGCSGYLDNGGLGAYWNSGAKLSSQTDLAIGAALNLTNSANGFAPGDVWTMLMDAPQAQSNAEGWTEYIVNGAQSPFTALGTTASTADVLSTVGLYKSAVAGTAPTGALVSSFSDFENSTNGTSLTTAILNAGTHGMGINQWTLDNPSAFTVCTAGALPSFSNTTTNGMTYAAGAGTRGICFNQQSGGQAYESISVESLTVTAYVNINVGANVTSYSAPVFVGAPGLDGAAFAINSSGQLELECSSANPHDYPISPATLAVANTTYGIWLQYVGGGMHTIKIYSNPTSNPSLIGTATCPAQATSYYATEAGIGEFQAGAAGATGTREFDSFMWDISGSGITIAPPGNTVSSYSDFENGSDGNPLTTTILNAGTHGAGVGEWSVPSSGFDVCTAGSFPTYLATTVIGGATYPAGAGTRGICYNMVDGGEALENINSKTVTLYVNVNLGTNVTQYSNPVIIGNFGVDDAAFTIKWTGQLELECPFANPEDYVISGANQAQANTTYGIWLQYNSAIGTHTIKIYSNPTTNPTLIGTASCPSQGSTAATLLGFGEFHGGAVGLTGIREFDSLLWDVSGHGITVIPTGNTVQATVGTNPAGLSFSVDGTAYTSTQILTWTIGTPHTLTTTSSQSPAAGTQDNFVNWSDGTTSASDSFTATTGTTSFTASFNSSYQLTTAVSPAAGGTVSPAAGAYYAQGTVVPLVATPNANYTFNGWTGSVASSTSASTTVTMSAPETVTAKFATTGQAPAITSASKTTFTTGVAGSFLVTATGSPTPSITQAGSLPSGVSFSTTTNTLIGTPAAGTAGTYKITFTASNGVGSNAVQNFTLTVANPATPTLTSVAPNSGARGTAVPVTLTGTNFTTGTTVAVSGSGVTVGTVTVVNSTSITTTFTISATATTGAANVTVKNPGGTSNSVPFTVLGPVLTSIAPNTGALGTSFPVTLTGSGLTSATTINLSNPGVSYSNLTVVNDTSVTATFTVAPTASLGAGTVSITTATEGASGTVAFTVVSPSAPTLISVAPNSGARGTAVPVTLTGTNFTTGTTVAVSGSGVTVGTVTVVNSTSITTTFTISATATTGAANVTVKNPGGTSNSVPFTVLGPVLTSIAPNTGALGTSFPVTLTGSGLTSATTINLSNPGVSYSNLTVVNDTSVTATFTVAPTASLGAGTVSITTATEGASGTVAFTVVSPSAPTLISVAPNSGARGTAVPVTLTGTNFTTGTTVAVSGSGVTVGTVTVVNSTSITTTFTISATATTGAANVTVKNPGGTSNSVPFTVLGPVLTSIAPTSGARGTSFPVTLSGSGLTGAATINLSNSGVSYSNLTVVNDTTVTATFTVTATASLGAGTVSVTTATEGATGTVAFTVVNVSAPTLASVAPNSGTRGTAVPVTLTGTNFTTAGTTVAVSGSGVTVGAITVVNSTTITTTFTISATATTGAANVTVKNASGTSNSEPFAVLGPVLTSIAPNTGALGTSFPVTLTGSGLTGATTINHSNSGVSYSNLTVVNDTTVTATLTVAATAAVGAGTISIATATEGTTNTVAFTVVNPAAPTLASVAPNSGTRGTAVPVTLTGTNFTTTGTTVAVSATGVTVGTVTVVNSTTITTTFTISATATTGAANVTVKNSGGTSNSEPFTVLGPVLTSIAPASGARGTSVPVTLIGSGLTGATTITISNSGVSASNLVVVNDTTVTATFTISSTANLSARNVSVTTTTEGATNNVTFTVINPPAPTLTSITPNSGLRGSTVPVTLTGTNFATTGTTVSVSGSGVTIGTITVVNSTTITTTFTITTSANNTARTVSVKTPGGTSGSQTFTVIGPTLTQVSPNPVTHGTAVTLTLTGTNLTGTTAVKVSGSSNSCTVGSSTSTTITATCNLGATGSRNVSATTAIGTTNTLSLTIN